MKDGNADIFLFPATVIHSQAQC